MRRMVWCVAAAVVALGGPAGAEQERVSSERERPPATGSGLRYEYHGAVGVYRFVPVCPTCSAGRYKPVDHRPGAGLEEGRIPRAAEAVGAPMATSLTPLASPEGALTAGAPRGAGEEREGRGPPPRNVLHEPERVAGSPSGIGPAARPGTTVPGDRSRKVPPPGLRVHSGDRVEGPVGDGGVIRYRRKPVIRYEGPARAPDPPRVWRVGPGFLIEG